MNNFLFNAKADPFFLVFLRMSTALILIVSLYSIWPDFNRIYGLNGIVDHELMALKQGVYSPSTYTLLETLMPHLQVDEASTLTFIFILYALLCLFLFVGLVTKATTFCLLFLQTSIFTSLPQFSYGFDYFCTVALFYCLVFPTARYGSIDKFLFKLTPSKWTGFCLRVLQIHICLVYFFSGIGKIIGHTWRNGEALWKTMHLPYFNNTLNVDGFAHYTWLWVIGGWSIALLEILYPLFVYFKVSRTLALALIILLHLSIAIFLNLYLFSAIMISLNLAAFYYGMPLHRPKKTATSYAEINE